MGKKPTVHYICPDRVDSIGLMWVEAWESRKVLVRSGFKAIYSATLEVRRAGVHLNTDRFADNGPSKWKLMILKHCCCALLVESREVVHHHWPVCKLLVSTMMWKRGKQKAVPSQQGLSLMALYVFKRRTQPIRQGMPSTHYDVDFTGIFCKSERVQSLSVGSFLSKSTEKKTSLPF